MHDEEIRFFLRKDGRAQLEVIIKNLVLMTDVNNEATFVGYI
jgi:hypothetical protein